MYITENYFGLESVDFDNVFRSGTECLDGFLNTSDCCTLYVKNTDTNTLEAIDKIVSIRNPPCFKPIRFNFNFIGLRYSNFQICSIQKMFICFVDNFI